MHKKLIWNDELECKLSEITQRLGLSDPAEEIKKLRIKTGNLNGLIKFSKILINNISEENCIAYRKIRKNAEEKRKMDRLTPLIVRLAIFLPFLSNFPALLLSKKRVIRHTTRKPRIVRRNTIYCHRVFPPTTFVVKNFQISIILSS